MKKKIKIVIITFMLFFAVSFKIEVKAVRIIDLSDSNNENVEIDSKYSWIFNVKNCHSLYFTAHGDYYTSLKNRCEADYNGKTIYVVVEIDENESTKVIGKVKNDLFKISVGSRFDKKGNSGQTGADAYVDGYRKVNINYSFYSDIEMKKPIKIMGNVTLNDLDFNQGFEMVSGIDYAYAFLATQTGDTKFEQMAKEYNGNKVISHGDGVKNSVIDCDERRHLYSNVKTNDTNFTVLDYGINNTIFSGNCGENADRDNAKVTMVFSGRSLSFNFYLGEPDFLESWWKKKEEFEGFGGGAFTISSNPIAKIMPSCPAELSRIKNKYGFESETDNSAARKELNDLYNKFKDKNYNLLLNFNNYKKQGISCGRFDESKLTDKDKTNNFTCDPKLDFDSSSNREHYYWYLSSENLSEISYGESTVKCKYTVSTSNSIINNGVSTIAGTSIWTTKLNENVFETRITKTCTGYGVSGADKNEIEKEIKNENYTLSLSGTNNYGGETSKVFTLSPMGASTGKLNVRNNGVEYEASITTTYAWKYGQDNTIYYKKGDSSFVNNLGATADKSNYVGPDYGFPTAITQEGGKVGFTLTLPANVKAFFGSDDELTTECEYKTTKDDDKETCIAGDDACPKVKEKLNVNFRIIKTSTGSEAFPGYNGKGRNTGLNWCSYAGKGKNGKNVVLNSKEVIRYNLLQKCLNGASTDESKKVCNVLYSDGIESIDNIDNACNNSNDVVTKEIVNSNNSYNSKDETPLISFTLNASNIKNIRSYNSKKTYDDWDIECSDEKGCRSAFVSNLLNKVNNYASINASSCEKGSNRKYCVGGNL